jgi:hypothetical protein
MIMTNIYQVEFNENTTLNDIRELVDECLKQGDYSIAWHYEMCYDALNEQRHWW